MDRLTSVLRRPFMTLLLWVVVAIRRLTRRPQTLPAYGSFGSWLRALPRGRALSGPRRRGRIRRSLSTSFKVLSLATVLAIILQPVVIITQVMIGAPVPVAEAHNLQTKMVYTFFDPDTQALLDNRINGPGWTPPQPLLQVGDELGMIIKVVPRDGTTTGVGGYIDFYVPNGVTVLDTAYLLPGSNPADGITGYDKVPMKGQSLIAVGDGPVGSATTTALVGLTLGPNINGVTANAVSATGVHNGTIAGVYGDTGIFYATHPDTAYDTYVTSGGFDQNTGTSDNTVKNNSGDLVIPLNKWDGEQLLAWGSSSPASPIVDPNGRGNSPWGLANGVAGPQSGYAWDFDWDYWRTSPKTPADMREASNQMGPWQRIQYPGSRVSKDQPGLKSTVLGLASVDASNLGRDLVANPLPATTSQTDGTSPKVIRWSIGQLTLNTPEFAWVKFRVNNTSAILQPDGCPYFYAGTFGGDAGGTDNGKDHLWRYYEPSRVTWNGCLALGKPATKDVVKVGDTFQYKVRVYNAGANNFTGLIVKDTLPSGVTFISAVPAQTSGPNPLVWNVGNLPQGDSFEALVTVKATGTGALENTLEATGITNGTPYTSTATDITSSGNIVLLNQNKTVTPTAVAPGGTVTYQIQIDNIGGGPTGSPVQITEYLPPGFTYINKTLVTINGANVTGTTTVNNANPNQPIFSVPGSLNAGQSLILQFTAQVGAGVPAGNYCNSYTTTQNGVPLTTGALACVNVGGGSIGDTVFRDWNGNGVQDPTDEGMAGVNVQLYAGACPPSGSPLQTQTTSASGAYLFNGLTAGNYCVDAPAPGAGGVPTGFTLTAGTDPLTVNLATNQAFTTADYGYKPAGTGSIGDTVFDDLNNNGVQNGGEAGIPGVTVELYEDTNGNGVIDPAADALIATTTTNGSGNYLFSNLATGLNYIVRVPPTQTALATYFSPNSYLASTTNPQSVTNLAGAYTAADFGFFGQTPGSIGDQVFIDTNGNGVYNAGSDTPIANVTVNLYRDANNNGVADPGEQVATTATAPDGTYTFSNLGPDNYLVVVDALDPDVPSGYFTTITQYNTTLGAGQNITTDDFPFVQALTKTVSQTTATPGNTLTFTVIPRYPSNDFLPQAVIVDTIPLGTTYVNASVNPAAPWGEAVDETDPPDGIIESVVWNLGATKLGTSGFKGGTPPAACATDLIVEANADTWLEEDDLDQNHGTDAAIETANEAGKDKVGLLRFSINPSTLPPGSIYNSATLRLTPDGGSGSNRQIEIHELLTNFTEGTDDNSACTVAGNGAAWQGPNCTDDWLSAGGNFGTSDYAASNLATLNPTSNDVTLSAPVTALVTGWLTTSSPKLLAMVPVGTANNTVDWASREDPVAARRPQIVINYTPNGCSGTALIRDDNAGVAEVPDADIDLDSPTNYFGTNNRLKTQPAANDKLRYALLKFALAGPDGILGNSDDLVPAGATVASASMRLEVASKRNNHVDNVHRLLTDWTEGTNASTGATWNDPNGTGTAGTWAAGAFSASDYNPTVLGSITPATSGGKTVVLTSLVQQWLANAVPNNGIVLISTGTDTGEASYYSSEEGTATRRPSLTVNWSIPPSNPSGSNTISASPTLVQNGDPVTVKMTLTDSSGVGINGVAPSSLTVTGTSGASAVCGAPLPATVNVPGNGSATITWTCTASVPVNTIGDVTFSASASSGATTWSSATSNSVIVARPLTFQVTVNNPAGVNVVENSATFTRGSDTPITSNTTQTSLTASIGDRVWADLNGNGLQDGGEAGLGGITVYADLNNNGVRDPGEPFATTNANGDYRIFGLTNGTGYNVKLDTTTIPAGYQPTTATTLTRTATTAGVNDADFGLRPPGPGSIGDTVWLDANNNGALDPGESGLPAITVRLYNDANNNGIAEPGELIATTATDANGAYTFPGLYAGAYLVVVDESSPVTSPFGVVSTLSAAMDPTTGTVNPKPVTLANGQNFTAADFGYNWSGSIGDRAWYDTDGDGVQDPGETLNAPDATFVLVYDLNGNGVVDLGEPPVQTFETDNTGIYTFANLPPGNYVVQVSEQEVPAPPSSPNAGDIGVMIATTGTNFPVALGAGQSITNIDAGFIEGASVEGKVFHDVNRNGLTDLAESALPNVEVSLKSPGPDGIPGTGDDVTVATTTTDANGEYAFIVQPGDYSISYNTADPDIPAALSDETTPTTLNITVPAGAEVSGLDFGLDNTGQIGDTVYNDANGNGVQDGAEPGLAGVTVELYSDPNGDGNPADGTLLATQATGPTGAYLFPGLADGNYVVVVNTATTPAGWTQTGDPDQPGVPCTTCDNRSGATITGGNTALTEDFGYRSPLTTFTLSGRVYNDANNNGNDDGEAGFPNVTVTVQCNTGTFTTNTNGTGAWSVSGIPQGSVCTVLDADETDLPRTDYAPTEAPTTPITVNANTSGLDFGYNQRPGSIAGTVCEGNGDGLCNVGEASIAGVTVTLRYAGDDGILNTADDVVTLTTTNASGDYSFTNLEPGLYQIVETDLPGYTSLADADGGNPNNISLTLALAQNAINQDFEDSNTATATPTITPTPTSTRTPTATPGPGAITGTVFNDTNGDGALDPGEGGIPGVTVNLYGPGPDGIFNTPDDNLITSTTTDGLGSYTFPNLTPGGYRVNEVDPPGYSSTSPNNVVTFVTAGSTSTVNFGDAQNTPTPTRTSSPSPSPTATEGVKTPTLQPDPTETPTATPTPSNTPLPTSTRTITPTPTAQLSNVIGKVWDDANNNGLIDPGEADIPGVTVNLYTPGLDGILGTGDDVLFLTTTTDGNGDYDFLGIPPGIYKVSEVDPPGYVSTTPNDVFITAPAGATIVVNFGDRLPPATVTPTPTPTTTATPTPALVNINGTVYNDQNGDQVKQPAEPGIPGVTVTLYTPGPDGIFGTPDDALVATTFTGAGGTYAFPPQPAGVYQIVESDPPGFTSTTPNTVVIVPPPGSTTTVNFGDQLIPTVTPTPTPTPTPAPGTGNLTGTVFNDINGNGTQDPGEPGIPGVTVTLIGPGPDGIIGTPDDVVLTTTVTDPSGAYTFNNLPPGPYRVVETDPPGYTSTTPNDVTTNVVVGSTTTVNFGDRAPTPTPTSTGTATLTPTPSLTPTPTGTATATPTNTVVVPPTNTPTVTPTLTVTPTPQPNLGILAGKVFEDFNSNGAPDVGEPGIPGVTVTLYTPGPDGIFGTPDDVLVNSTVTDGLGNYSFPNLSPGSYQVVETQPAGYTSTTPNIVVVPVVAGGTTIVNFGELRTTPTPTSTSTATPSPTPGPGAINGTVFNDLNSNGTQDPGEPGIPGVTVTLYTPGPDGILGTPDDVPVASATTDPNGDYSFPNLPAGVYQVRETDLPGYISTTPNNVGVLLPPGGTVTVDFGDFLPPTVTPTPTNTPVGPTVTPTPTSTNTPVPPTVTPTPTPTNTPVGPTNTPTPTDTPTNTPTPTDTPTNTPTPTDTPTNTPTPMDTPTNTPTSTNTAVPPTVTPTSTNTAVPPTVTPTSTNTPVPPTVTPTPTPTQTVPPGAPLLTATKRDLLTDVDGNSAASPGDVLLYLITIQNSGTGAATGVVFTDTPDVNTTLVSGTVFTSQGTIVSGNAGVPPVQVNIGTIPAGGTVTIAFQVTINNPLPAGTTQVSNQGLVTSPDHPNVPTDDPDTPNEPNDPTDTPVVIPTPTPTVTATPTNTPVGPTATRTVTPTATNTPVGPTATPTATATSTATPLPPTVTVTPTVTPTLAPNDPRLTATKRDLLTDVDGNGVASPGDVLLYFITIQNVGFGPANGVVFTDTPDSNTTLVNGSVSTSQGVILSGNAGLPPVAVFVGTIPAGGTVTITFQVSINNPLPTGTTQVSNQGLVTSPNTPNTPTDDPDTPNEPNDPTDTPVTVPGRITGTVFNDVSGDGIQNGTEVGIPGVTVQYFAPGPDGILGTGDDVLSGTTTTDANGNYTFSPVNPGPYLVIETDPAGYSSTTSNIVPVNVPAGGAAIADFGDQQRGTVNGNVYHDLNGNGVQDPGEPGLPGVTVTLVAPGPDGIFGTPDDVLTPTTTDANGNYSFPGVPPGPYQVVETDPAGFISTTPNTVPISVPPGGSASATFGDQQPARITGVVWNDVDGSTTFDVGEVGIPGVTVQLFAPGPDNVLGTGDDVLVGTTTTNASGDYVFAPVAPGPYLVRETDPVGFSSTTPNTVGVSVPAGGSANADFGDRQQGVVSGTVFVDTNGDGVQNPGEVGLSGVPVTLVAPGPDGIFGTPDDVTTTTLTDPNGNYSFPGTPPGTYQVIETDPPGFVSTTPNVAPVVVPAGGSATVNFGDQPLGAVSGVVWNDVNADQTQNVGEAGIGGVTVTLVAPGPDNVFGTGDDVVVGTTTTAGDGSYLFTGVPGGSYQVVETDPPGFISTTPNTAPVVVPVGGSGTANFGDRQPGGVVGTVFDDVNGNGVQDPGEPGIPGVTVTLLGPGPDGILGTADDVIVATTTTDPNGNYSFPNVPPGTYLVQETDPPGYTSTTPNTVPVVVPSGGGASANFGDQLIGRVVGTVFNDLNGTGVQDPGEPGIPGVTIRLFAPGTDGIFGTGDDFLVGTTTTVGDGSYLFAGVIPGPYQVRETDPAGFVSTTPNAVNVTVPTGGSAVADFGDRQVGSISGVVVNDINGDGTPDPGEPGIPGVTVTLVLLGPDGIPGTGDDVILDTTTTGPNGLYSFTDLPTGSYGVIETDPAGFTSTSPNAVPVTLPPGGSASVNFTDRQIGSITGVVYNDLNGNQVQDPGEPGIGGVTVTLINPGPNGIFGDGDDTQTSTLTLPDGSYQFLNLPVGNYRVRETDPPGYTSTTPNLVSVAVPPGGINTVNFGDQLVEEPTNVELESFLASTTREGVQLEWRTVTEINTLGFNIWRSDSAQGTYEQINSELIVSEALGTIGTRYEFLDRNRPAGTWYYKLEVIGTDGQTMSWYGAVSVQVQSAPQWKLFLPVVIKQG